MRVQKVFLMIPNVLAISVISRNTLKSEKVHNFLISCPMSNGQRPHSAGPFRLANLAHNGKVETLFSLMQSL